MNREEEAKRLADDLESFRAGTLSEVQLRAKHHEGRSSELLDAARQGLEHYLGDCDIRERDPIYRAMQEAEFDKLVSLLRSGGSSVEVARITFLAKSAR